MIQTWCRNILGAIAATSLFAMMGVTFVDVIGRYILGAPLRGAYELTEYLLPLTIFAALPLVTWQREHVTTGLFENAVRGRLAQYRDCIADFLGAIACGYAAYALYGAYAASALLGENSTLLGLPKPPVIVFIVMTTALAAATLLVLAAADLRRESRTQP